MTVLAEAVHLAQITANSGSGFARAILGVLGTFFALIMSGRMIAAFADERYGKLITLILAAVPVAGFLFFPEQSMDLLKWIFKQFVG